jgi:hypothetical protein
MEVFENVRTPPGIRQVDKTFVAGQMLLMQDPGLTFVQELCTTLARGSIEESRNLGQA